MALRKFAAVEEMGRRERQTKTRHRWRHKIEPKIGRCSGGFRHHYVGVDLRDTERAYGVPWSGWRQKRAAR